MIRKLYRYGQIRFRAGNAFMRCAHRTPPWVSLLRFRSMYSRQSRPPLTRGLSPEVTGGEISLLYRISPSGRAATENRTAIQRSCETYPFTSATKAFRSGAL